MKPKINNLLYIFFYIMVFCKGIGLTNSSKIYYSVIVVWLFIIAIKMLSNKYKKKELLFIAISNLIGAICFFKTKSPTLFLTTLTMSSLKNINIEKLFNGMLNTRAIAFITIIFLALIGVVENIEITMWRMGHLDTRYGLGFAHPNTLHLSLFIIFALYIYVKFDKIKFKDYIWMFLINLFIYKFSLSRTGFMLIILLILITVLSKKISITKKVICKLPRYVLILSLITSFGFGLLYGKINILDKVNTILNGRINYSSYFLKQYEPSLFGHNYYITSDAILDNGYLLLYVQNGILGLTLILFIIWQIIKKVEKENDIPKVILLILFLIYLNIESFAANIFMNIILLYFAEILFKTTKNIKKMRKEESNEKQKLSEFNSSGL